MHTHINLYKRAYVPFPPPPPPQPHTHVGARAHTHCDACIVSKADTHAHTLCLSIYRSVSDSIDKHACATQTQVKSSLYTQMHVCVHGFLIYRNMVYV